MLVFVCTLALAFVTAAVEGDDEEDGTGPVPVPMPFPTRLIDGKDEMCETGLVQRKKVEAISSSGNKSPVSRDNWFTAVQFPRLT